jgi:hypothetical protein
MVVSRAGAGPADGEPDEPRRWDDPPQQPGPIDGAVFDGPYEGCSKRMAAAERLARYDYDVRAGIAIRGARNGDEDCSFRAADGVVWHLRRVED